MKCSPLLTFLHFFFLLEDFANFLHNKSVSLHTQAEHRGPCDSCLDHHLQGTCGEKVKIEPHRSMVFFVISLLHTYKNNAHIRLFMNMSFYECELYKVKFELVFQIF